MPCRRHAHLPLNTVQTTKLHETQRDRICLESMCLWKALDVLRKTTWCELASKSRPFRSGIAYNPFSSTENSTGSSSGKYKAIDRW